MEDQLSKKEELKSFNDNYLNYLILKTFEILMDTDSDQIKLKAIKLLAQLMEEND